MVTIVQIKSLLLTILLVVLHPNPHSESETNAD